MLKITLKRLNRNIRHLTIYEIHVAKKMIEKIYKSF